MNLLPENIEDFFRFRKDPITGDNERYHLYCYYNSGAEELSFHCNWQLSGTQVAIAGVGASKLRDELKIEESRRFKIQIERHLQSQRQVLVEVNNKLALTASPDAAPPLAGSL